MVRRNVVEKRLLSIKPFLKSFQYLELRDVVRFILCCRATYLLRYKLDGLFSISNVGAEEVTSILYFLSWSRWPLSALRMTGNFGNMRYAKTFDFPTVSALDLEGVGSDAAFLSITAMFRSLRELRIRTHESPLLLSDICMGRYLQRAALSIVPSIVKVSSVYNIRVIDLHCSVSTVSLEGFLSQLFLLEELRLCGHLHDSLSLFNPRLIVLHVDFSSHTGGLIRLSGCGSLRKVSSDCGWIYLLVSVLPDLTVLKIKQKYLVNQDAWLMKDDGIESICRGLPNLVELELLNCFSFQKPWFSSVLVRLRYFTAAPILGNVLQGDFMYNFLIHCPILETLHLEGFCGFNGVLLDRLVKLEVDVIGNGEKLTEILTRTDRLHDLIIHSRLIQLDWLTDCLGCVPSPLRDLILILPELSLSDAFLRSWHRGGGPTGIERLGILVKKVDGITKKGWPRFSRLEQLELNVVGKFSISSLIWTLLSCTESLVDLRVIGGQFQDSVGQTPCVFDEAVEMPNLQNLELVDCELDDFGFARFLNLCPNLVHLRVSNIVGLDSPAFPLLPYLQEIRLKDTLIDGDCLIGFTVVYEDV